MAMQAGTKRPMNDINVTPLIDVVLVLLIIFMVLTPLAEKQMFMRVPEYEPDTQVVPPEQEPGTERQPLGSPEPRTIPGLG